MTYHKYKNIRKTRVKSIISTILILLFGLISSIILVAEKKKLRSFDERVFYLVSVASSRKISLLDDKKELLKNLGGANIVFEYKGQSHLIASVYLDQESASEIKGNMQEYFDGTEVLKIKSKRVSTKGIKAIKDIAGAEEFIKYLYKISLDFENLQMGYLSGGISESEFISKMVDRRIRLEKERLNIENVNDLAETIINRGEIINFKLTSFLNGFSVAKHKQNYVCNYFVEFYLSYVELFECL